MTEEETKGLLGIGRQLVAGLPAQFLALVLVNVLLIGGWLWHMDSQLAARERVLLKLVESCSGR